MADWIIVWRRKEGYLNDQAYCESEKPNES